MKSKSKATRYLKCAGYAASVLLLVGCASVRVRKVPSPMNYSHWTDKQQRKADRMEGIRYYLPRPHINVHESFPIRADHMLVNGTVSADGKYVVLDQPHSNAPLAHLMSTDPKGGTIPSSAIAAPSAESLGNLAQSLVAAQSKSGTPKEETPNNNTPSTHETPSPPAAETASSSAPVTGIERREVTNDNGAYAYQPMRGNMDIVYLPDFDEQYVVKGKSGLGNANFSVKLGQGWSLQGFNSESDNSELNKRIFDTIDSGIELAKAAAKAAVGVPPVSLPDGGIGTIKPQGKSIGNDQAPGTRVTVRVTRIYYAAKGLYPVIKPRELEVRIDKTEQDFMFLDLFRWFPQDRFVSIRNPEARNVAISSEARHNPTGNFTVPYYPFQYISFNTFSYVAYELIRADQPSVPHLPDKTGTSGDPGDRRLTLPPRNTGTTTVSPSTNTEPTESQIEVWLAEIKGKYISGDSTDGWIIEDATYRKNVKVLDLTVDRTGTGTSASKTEQEIKRAAEELANDKKHYEAARLNKLPGISSVGITFTPKARKSFKAASTTSTVKERVNATLEEKRKIEADTGAFIYKAKSLSEAKALTVEVKITDPAPSVLFTLEDLQQEIQSAINNGILNEGADQVSSVIIDPDSLTKISVYLRTE